MPVPKLVSFAGGATGDWQVESIVAIRGTGLLSVQRVSIVEGGKVDDRAQRAEAQGWVLRGTTSNERYVERSEKVTLIERQEGLGRPAATCAALIPMTKSPEWWELSQDERRAVFEERSAHIAIGAHYLPAIARRLHHGRDLAEEFDFVTWFEYRPADSNLFEELVGRLRETEEWTYVVREVDVRMQR
jgi:chlorite dismutase